MLETVSVCIGSTISVQGLMLASVVSTRTCCSWHVTGDERQITCRVRSWYHEISLLKPFLQNRQKIEEKGKNQLYVLQCIPADIMDPALEHVQRARRLIADLETPAQPPSHPPSRAREPNSGLNEDQELAVDR